MVLADGMRQKVNLFVSGRKLKNLDTFSKSDPICILFEQRDGDWKMIGRTECIENTLNPDFETSFTVDYYFEKAQNFRFVMIDGDGVYTDTSDYDEIGSVEVQMGRLMGAPKQVWKEKLFYKGEKRGKIIVRTQTVSNALANVSASFGLEMSNVNNVEECLCCTSFRGYVFLIQKQVPGDSSRFVTLQTVFRAGERRSFQSTEPFEFDLAELCGGDKMASIIFVWKTIE